MLPGERPGASTGETIMTVTLMNTQAKNLFRGQWSIGRNDLLLTAVATKPEGAEEIILHFGLIAKDDDRNQQWAILYADLHDLLADLEVRLSDFVGGAISAFMPSNHELLESQIVVEAAVTEVTLLVITRMTDFL